MSAIFPLELEPSFLLSFRRRLVLKFDKVSLRNQELRVKFPDAPDKFMQSEVELHESIQELRSLATAPDLYPMLVELGCVKSFLGLLSHENADVAVAAVDLLQELTDVDTLNESEEGAEALVESLANQQACPLLVQNLERLDESVREEAEGVHATLAVFENLVEFRPAACGEAAEAGLIQWLIKKLKVRVPFDGNKLYASEMLSVLLQGEPANRKRVGEMSGAMDTVLQQLAYYKRHEPGSAEEEELMENLFDCVCSLLLYTPNREGFLKGEGVQLMNLMLREKKTSRNGALKALDYALVGPEGADCCQKFVDILGLRSVFPLFMKTPKKSRRKGISAEKHEEHVVSIVASLLKNCKGAQKQRVLTKFTENDHEKVERIMELHFKYLDKVQGAEEAGGRGRSDEDPDEAYLRRLDGGLFTLQQVDFVVAEVAASGASTVKPRLMKILNQRNASVADVREVLREYAGNYDNNDGRAGDNEEDESVRERERQYLLQLVDKF